MSTIRAACPRCQKTLAVPEKYAGREGKCPGCGGVVRFASAGVTARPAATPQPSGVAPPPMQTPFSQPTPQAPARTPLPGELPTWQWTLLIIGVACCALVVLSALMPWFGGMGIARFPVLFSLAGVTLLLGVYLVVSHASSRVVLVLTGALATLVWLLIMPLPWKQLPAPAGKADKTALILDRHEVFAPPTILASGESGKKRPKDVMIVLEASAHMAGRMDAVKNDIRVMAKRLWEKNPDSRVGVTIFHSHLDRKMRLIREEKGSGELGAFTRDAAEFGRKVGALRADGGGDTPESAFDAAELASRQTYRDDADKVVILITDAPPRVPDKIVRNAEEVAEALRRAKIKQFHFMCPRTVLDFYGPVMKEFPGQHFELAFGGGFTSILEKLSKDIADLSYKQRALVPSAVKKNQIRADIMFLLDTTGSMGGAITGVQAGIASFARELVEKKLDARFAIISFKDQIADAVPLELLTFRQTDFRVEEPVITSIPEVRVLGPDKGPWLDKEADLDAVLNSILPSGNSPEQNSLDALATAARQPFRPDADKVIVLITDSPGMAPDREMIEPIDVVDVLREKRIDYIHLVTPEKARPFFSTLHNIGRGKTEIIGGPIDTSWIDTLPPMRETKGPLTRTTTSPDVPRFASDPSGEEPAVLTNAGIGAWLGFAAATGMALCFLIVSLCRPTVLGPATAFSDLPRMLRRVGPALAAQGFAVMIGLFVIALNRT